MERDTTVIDINLVKVIFPCPTTLGMSSANDQINIIQSMAEFIIRSLLGEPPQSPPPGDDSYERLKNALFKQIVYKYLPNIDWKDFDGLLERARIEAAKSKVEDDADAADSKADTDESYM